MAIRPAEVTAESNLVDIVRKRCHRKTRGLIGAFKSLMEELSYEGAHELVGIQDYTASQIRARKQGLCFSLHTLNLPIVVDDALLISVSDPKREKQIQVEDFQTALPGKISVPFSTSLKKIVGDDFVQMCFSQSNCAINELGEDYLPECMREDDLVPYILSLPHFIASLMVLGSSYCASLIALNRFIAQGYRPYGLYRDTASYVVLVA